MPAYTVEVEGTPLDSVSHVERETADEGELGTAKVVCSNTTANRSVESGDNALIKRNGETIFRGKITKAPTRGQTGEQLEFTIADKRVILKYIEAHRPFYNMDPGAIVRSAVTEQAQVRSPRFVHTADDLTDWDSDTPEFDLLSVNDKQLHEYGSDAVFAGWPGGASGEYELTYDGISSSAIPGDGKSYGSPPGCS